MYRVIVESHFSATHHLRLHDGSEEPSHGHDWIVRVTFARSRLDELGMVIDFAQARSFLDQVLSRLQYRDLHEPGLLDGHNPTAEVVAEWISRRMVQLGARDLEQVEVTEAPGCVAIYTPG